MSVERDGRGSQSCAHPSERGAPNDPSLDAALRRKTHQPRPPSGSWIGSGRSIGIDIRHVNAHTHLEGHPLASTIDGVPPGSVGRLKTLVHLPRLHHERMGRSDKHRNFQRHRPMVCTTFACGSREIGPSGCSTWTTVILSERSGRGAPEPGRLRANGGRMARRDRRAAAMKLSGKAGCSMPAVRRSRAGELSRNHVLSSQDRSRSRG